MAAVTSNTCQKRLTDLFGGWRLLYLSLFDKSWHCSMNLGVVWVPT